MSNNPQILTHGYGRCVSTSTRALAPIAAMPSVRSAHAVLGAWVTDADFGAAFGTKRTATGPRTWSPPV